MDATKTRDNAYGAAWANWEMEVAVQSEVERVSKLVGLSMRVAGSSFMALTKTSNQPEKIPGVAIGKITFLRVA